MTIIHRSAIFCVCAPLSGCGRATWWATQFINSRWKPTWNIYVGYWTHDENVTSRKYTLALNSHTPGDYHIKSGPIKLRHIASSEMSLCDSINASSSLRVTEPEPAEYIFEHNCSGTKFVTNKLRGVCAHPRFPECSTVVPIRWCCTHTHRRRELAHACRCSLCVHTTREWRKFTNYSRCVTRSLRKRVASRIMR